MPGIHCVQIDINSQKSGENGYLSKLSCHIIVIFRTARLAEQD